MLPLQQTAQTPISCYIHVCRTHAGVACPTVPHLTHLPTSCTIERSLKVNLRDQPVKGACFTYAAGICKEVQRGSHYTPSGRLQDYLATTSNTYSKYQIGSQNSCYAGCCRKGLPQGHLQRLTAANANTICPLMQTPRGEFVQSDISVVI